MKIDVSFLDNLDQLIKRGHGDEVRSALNTFSLKEVPRKHCAAVAKLALRMGEAQIALSVLKPIIQSEKPVHPAPSQDECIQYGMCLNLLGASDHALKIFQRLSVYENPEVLLYQSVTLFTQWRYSEAIPKLILYLESSATNEYQKMIGRLNLASAFIFETRYDEAAHLLHLIAQEAKKQNHHLLRGNSLELMAQVAIYQKQFTAADAYIKEASALIHQSAPSYRLFLEKWSAVSKLYQTGGDLASLQNLNWVREKAIELKLWESVRDCDFFFAIVKNDRHLFDRLYFGTPHKAYRQRLLRFDPNPKPISRHFDWRGNTAHQPTIEKPKMLDLGAKSSGQNWRLLKALSMDFYAPMKAFALYLHLFPEENLDPEAALPRIYSSVLRVKKWLKSQQVPIEIEHSDAGYRLIWTAPFVLRIPSAINFQKISSTGFEILLKNFSTQSFSSTEAAMVLDLPQRSVARLLKEAAIGENLEVTGQGRKTRYRFKNAKAS